MARQCTLGGCSPGDWSLDSPPPTHHRCAGWLSPAAVTRLREAVNLGGFRGVCAAGDERGGAHGCLRRAEQAGPTNAAARSPLTAIRHAEAEDKGSARVAALVCRGTRGSLGDQHRRPVAAHQAGLSPGLACVMQPSCSLNHTHSPGVMATSNVSQRSGPLGNVSCTCSGRSSSERSAEGEDGREARKVSIECTRVSACRPPAATVLSEKQQPPARDGMSCRQAVMPAPRRAVSPASSGSGSGSSPFCIRTVAP